MQPASSLSLPRRPRYVLIVKCLSLTLRVAQLDILNPTPDLEVELLAPFQCQTHPSRMCAKQDQAVAGGFGKYTQKAWARRSFTLRVGVEERV